MKRTLIITLVAVLAAACGGGGGGGGSGGAGGGSTANSGTPAGQASGVTFTPSAFHQTLPWGADQPVGVSMYFSDKSLLNGVTGAVYGTVTDLNGVLKPTVQINGAGSYLFQANIFVSQAAASGHYQGTFQLKLCADSQCQTPLPGSPWLLPYDLNITAASYGTGPYNTVMGVAFDSSGNFYVADATSSLLQKFTPAGAVSMVDNLLSLTAINGVANDQKGGVVISYSYDNYNPLLEDFNPSQPLNWEANGRYPSVYTEAAPAGLASDAAGNVYFADPGNVIGLANAKGAISAYAGTPGLNGAGTPGFVDGTGGAARFNTPNDVALDAGGNLYVADSGNHAIRKIAPGGIVTTLAGNGATGYADGTGAAARFAYPTGLALDAAGNIFVADSGNNTIRKVAPGGAVTTIAGDGSASNVGYVDATGASARFNGAFRIAVAPNGDLYVSDKGNGAIRVVTQAGVVSTLIAGGK